MIMSKFRTALCGRRPPVSNYMHFLTNFGSIQRSLLSRASGTLQISSGSDAACLAAMSFSKSAIRSTGRGFGEILAQELLAPGHSMCSLAPCRVGSEQYSVCTLRASASRRVHFAGLTLPSPIATPYGKFWMRVSAVKAKYQSAVLNSGLVTFIAACHYIRIFYSWVNAYSYAGRVGQAPVLTSCIGRYAQIFCCICRIYLNSFLLLLMCCQHSTHRSCLPML